MSILRNIIRKMYYDDGPKDQGHHSDGKHKGPANTFVPYPAHLQIHSDVADACRLLGEKTKGYAGDPTTLNLGNRFYPGKTDSSYVLRFNDDEADTTARLTGRMTELHDTLSSRSDLGFYPLRGDSQAEKPLHIRIRETLEELNQKKKTKKDAFENLARIYPILGSSDKEDPPYIKSFIDLQTSVRSTLNPDLLPTSTSCLETKGIDDVYPSGPYLDLPYGQNDDANKCGIDLDLLNGALEGYKKKNELPSWKTALQYGGESDESNLLHTLRSVKTTGSDSGIGGFASFHTVRHEEAKSGVKVDVSKLKPEMFDNIGKPAYTDRYSTAWGIRDRPAGDMWFVPHASPVLPPIQNLPDLEGHVRGIQDRIHLEASRRDAADMASREANFGPIGAYENNLYKNMFVPQQINPVTNRTY